uniref:Tocopherol cyclase n=1 Tax=Populus trichocarpa TaxID=3694 RepID=A0A2K1WVM0_POPTR|eukprot:XP_006371708.2 tocopherol cyclase, chloroplastic [Populus trichocarpa]
MEVHIHNFSPNFSPLRPLTNPNSSIKLYHSRDSTFSITLSKSLKLGFRSSPLLAASTPITNTDTSLASNGENERSVSPVYVPTPPNRGLRTPHSGYHYDGTTRNFFEGWYFKVSIPERKQNFCFMYSVENPAFPKKLTALESAQHGSRSIGVGAQILGAYDKYICQFSEESQDFWGSRHELALGNTFVAERNMRPPTKEVPPQEFDKRVIEGFQVSPLWHQGFIRDDGRSDYVETVKTARWQYSTQPVYGWGNVGSTQKSTAGWLAAFPVFEPHWQICMAGGLSTGWIEWDGERFEFEDAPSYSEKNWGGAFPRKWFWVQCNVFEGASGEVALTAAGGLRQIPGPSETFENAALVGVHYDGIFYEFVPWNGVVNWEISPWGYWYMAADNGTHLVELEATTKELGTALRAPTAEAGLSPACKDTGFSFLKLQIWERRYDGTKGKLILDVTSDMALVEVGGGPWFTTWKGKTSMPELVSRTIGAPIDVDGIFSFVPLFKPPGL